MDEDPMVPVASRHPNGVGEALIYNFFDRDPYTRRHRSRSMAEIYDPMPPHGVSPAAVNGVGNGVTSNGANNGVPIPSVHTVGNGVVRLMSAEL